jgi:hypothetical protein
MNIEIYEPWPIPSPASHDAFAFDEMHVVGGSLIIELHEASENRRRMKIEFASWPLTIKMANESYRLSSIERLPRQKRGSFYLVRNSELLESFHKDSLGIYSGDPLQHMAIITDEWIDLIFSDPPRISLTEENQMTGKT